MNMRWDWLGSEFVTFTCSLHYSTALSLQPKRGMPVIRGFLKSGTCQHCPPKDPLDLGTYPARHHRQHFVTTHSVGLIFSAFHRIAAPMRVAPLGWS